MGIKLNSVIKRNKPKKEIIIEEEILEEEDFEEIEEPITIEEAVKETLFPEESKKGKDIVPPSVTDVITESLEDLKRHDVTVENVIDQTDKIIEKVHQSAVMHTVKHNEDVQKKVITSAEEQVLSSIEIKRNQQALKVTQASYNANRDACENLGLGEEGRPMWQIRVAKAINNFWFVVWAILSSFTLTPIIFFLKRIGTQVKSAKLKWLLTMFFYLSILFGIFILVLVFWNMSPNAPDWIRNLLGGKQR